MQTVNVRIKTFPGNPPRPATNRVQLPKLSPEERAKGKAFERPLEPGEVCEMPKAMAIDFLTHLEHELEMTLLPATRKVYFNDQFEAERTSESFRPGVTPRSDEVKAEVLRQREAMAKKIEAMQNASEDEAAAVAEDIDPATVAPDDVAAAMALLSKHGYTVSNDETAEPQTITVNPETLEVDEDNDYVPKNNAITPKEVDEERRKYQEEQAAIAAGTEEKPKRKRRKTAAKAEDGPPPATKRRRRGTNS